MSATNLLLLCSTGEFSMVAAERIEAVPGTLGFAFDKPLKCQLTIQSVAVGWRHVAGRSHKPCSRLPLTGCPEHCGVTPRENH